MSVTVIGGGVMGLCVATELQGRGNATGFPKIVLRGSAAHVVWTDVEDGTPRLHGAIVNPAPSP